MPESKKPVQELTPSRLQIQYLLELKDVGTKRGNVTVIAERCGVNHSSVSKFFKTCVKAGYLEEDFSFTEAGIAWMQGYETILTEVKQYLKEIGIADRQIDTAAWQLIENTDFYVLKKMVHHEEKNQQTKSSDGSNHFGRNLLEGVLKFGNYPVDFMLYRVGSGSGISVSMSNRGFKHPALLKHNRRGSWLQLEIQEMQAQSRIDGMMMEGYLQSLKYEKDGYLHEVEIRDNTLRLPLNAFRFDHTQGGEINARIPVTVSCSVGREHMPESTALLVFWM